MDAGRMRGSLGLDGCLGLQSLLIATFYPPLTCVPCRRFEVACILHRAGRNGHLEHQRAYIELLIPQGHLSVTTRLADGAATKLSSWRITVIDVFITILLFPKRPYPSISTNNLGDGLCPHIAEAH